jgi:hypothetical protein
MKLFSTSGLVILLVASVAFGTLSLLAANRIGTPEQRAYDVTYEFTLHDIPSDASDVIAWVPLPLSDKWQTLERFSIEPDRPHEIIEEKEFGNRFLRIDLSGGGQRTSDSIKIALHFRAKRQAYRALEAPTPENEKPSSEALERYLSPDRLIPTDGKIAQESRRVAGDVDDPLKQSRKSHGAWPGTSTILSNARDCCMTILS